MNDESQSQLKGDAGEHDTEPFGGKEEDYAQPNIILLGDTEKPPEMTEEQHYHAVFSEAHKWSFPGNLACNDAFVNVKNAYQGGGTQQLECMSGNYVVATRLTPENRKRVEKAVSEGQISVSSLLPQPTKNKSCGNVVVGRWSTDPNAKPVYAQPPKHMCLGRNPVEIHDQLNQVDGARAGLALVSMKKGCNPFWYQNTQLTFDLPCVLTANGEYLAVSNSRGSPLQLIQLTGLRPKVVWLCHLLNELGERYRITRLMMTNHYLIALLVCADCPTPVLRFWLFDSQSEEFKLPTPVDHLLTVNDFILRIVEHPESPHHLILALWSGRVCVVPVRPESKFYTVPKGQVIDTMAPVTRLYVPKAGPLCYAITSMGVQVLMVPPPDINVPITRLGTIYLPSVAHICSHKGVIVLVTHDARTCISVVGNFEFRELPALAQRARYALDQKNHYGSTCDRAIHMDDDRIIIAFPNGTIRTITLK